MMRRGITFFLLILFQVLAFGSEIQHPVPLVCADRVIALPVTRMLSNDTRRRSEMERGSVYDYTVLKTNQAPDQSAGRLANHYRRLLSGLVYASGATCPPADLFGNSNLLHNYPAHNFW